MILTHFESTTKLLLTVAAGTSGTGGYGAGKKTWFIFHDAWNEYAVVLPEKIRNLVSPSVLDCITTWDCLDLRWLQR
jgi:hypothetical protein